MKITIDLKDFEQILYLGIKAMFKEDANITDVITPFGTFHINNELIKRQPLFNEINDYIKRNELINAIKAFRVHTGVGLKHAKDFCERFRDDAAFAQAWLKGDDSYAAKNFHYSDLDAYNSWKGRLQ